MTDNVVPVLFRTVIIGALTVCLTLAAAPWMSGGQEPLARLISAGALLLGAMLVWRQPEVRRLRRGPLLASYAGLMVFAGLSLLWTANRYSTVVWLMGWLAAGLAFWLAYVVGASAIGRRWLLRAYLVSAVVFGVSGVIMYLLSDYERLTGTFYWANPAAAYVLPGILIGLGRLRQSRGKRLVIWVGVSAFLLAVFLLTDSRGALLVLAAMTAVYLVIAPTPKPFWIKFVFTIVLGAGLSFGLVLVSNNLIHHQAKAAPGERLVGVAQTDSTSGSDRLYYLRSAFDIWWQHPLGGTGAGTYGDVHPQYQLRTISASDDAHNLYAQTMSELGLIGIVLLLSTVVWLAAGILRGIVSNPELVPVALGVAGLWLHFGLDIDARYPALLILAAVLSGLCWRQLRQQWISPGWRGTALAIGLLVLATITYQGSVWAQRAAVMQDDGDYETAADDYAQAYNSWVSNPDWINAEGIARYTTATMGGDGAKATAATALDRARQAQVYDPYDAQHHQLEGRILAWQGDLPAAQQALKAALRLDPYNHPDYALDLASIQARAGDTSAAATTARSMLAQYTDLVVNNRSSDPTIRPSLANLEALLGNLALGRGDMAEASRAAEAALKYDPANLRGRALMNQIDKAQEPH